MSTQSGDPGREDPRREDGALEAALEVWRDDARRTAARLDLDTLAERVLASTESLTAAGQFASRAYAAAAVILIALGALGAAWIGPQGPAAASASTTAVVERVENALIDLQVDRESSLVLDPNR